MTARKSTPAKPKAKTAAAPAAPSAPRGPSTGSLVTWTEPANPEEGQAVETFVGLLVHDDVELGPDDKGKDQTGARVAVLSDVRVLDPKQLKKL